MKKENEYWKSSDVGDVIQIMRIDDICKMLKVKFNDIANSRDYWKNEFQKSQSESYKDDEIQKLKKENAELKEQLKYGFGLTKSENDEILKWKRSHGCDECTLVYHFTPTPLGLYACVECDRCGKKFIFKIID